MSDKNILFRYLEKQKDEKLSILEVGVAQCQTGINILNMFPNFNYTGIDKWEYDTSLEHEVKKIQNWNSQEKWDEIYKKVLENTKIFGERCKIIRKDSVEGLSQIKNTFDFIHVDGDHSAEGVFKDLNTCCRLLSKNGIMWMDDMELASIKKGVAKFLDNNKKFKLKDHCIIYKDE